MKTGLEMALHLVEIRQKEADGRRDDAIQRKKWSHVSGFDGIAVGLMMAAKIIRDEIGAENRH